MANNQNSDSYRHAMCINKQPDMVSARLLERDKQKLA